MATGNPGDKGNMVYVLAGSMGVPPVSLCESDIKVKWL